MFNYVAFENDCLFMRTKNGCVCFGILGEFSARLMMIFSEGICSIMSEDNGSFTYYFHIVRKVKLLRISDNGIIK